MKSKTQKQALLNTNVSLCNSKCQPVTKQWNLVSMKLMVFGSKWFNIFIYKLSSIRCSWKILTYLLRLYLLTVLFGGKINKIMVCNLPRSNKISLIKIFLTQILHRSLWSEQHWLTILEGLITQEFLIFFFISIKTYFDKIFKFQLNEILNRVSKTKQNTK